MDHQEAYRTLAITPPFTEDTLKSAFREAAMRTHPDKGGDAAQFRSVREAFELLIPDARIDERVKVIHDEATIDGIFLKTLGLKGKNLAKCTICEGKGYTSRFDDGWGNMTMVEILNYVIDKTFMGENPHRPPKKPSYIHFLCPECKGSGAKTVFNPVFQASAFVSSLSQKERKRMIDEMRRK